MEVKGDYKFKAPHDQVWSALLSQKVLEQALPGLEKFEVIGDRQYDVTIRVGVAVLKGTYNGKISIIDIADPNHFKLVVEGAGNRGHLNGEAAFEVTPVKDDSRYHTVVNYDGQAFIGGTLAGFGSRLLSPVARLLIGNFFKGLEKQLEGFNGTA